MDGRPGRRADVGERSRVLKTTCSHSSALQYDSYGGRRSAAGAAGAGGGWATDYPDSDLNFSFRLQQLTSLKVNPNPVILRARPTTQLFDYPFIYMIEPGRP